MAMPKLILKSVLWGVDRVPDHWFEKVPGGYYSPKEEDARRQNRRSNAGSRDKDGRSSGSSSRRHSMDSDIRGRRRDESRRQDSPSRRNEYRRSERSYDSSVDDRRSRRDDDDDERDRRRERRRTADPEGRRRSVDDYGAYAAGRGARDYDPRFVNQPRAVDPNMAAASTIPPPPIYAQNRMSMQDQRPDGRGSVASSYTPYADLYGSPASSVGAWPPPPPAQQAPMPMNPGSQHQPMPLPNQYRQNPYAQQPQPNANYAAPETPIYNAYAPNQYDPGRMSNRYNGNNGPQVRSASLANQRSTRYTPAGYNTSDYVPPENNVIMPVDDAPDRDRSHSSKRKSTVSKSSKNHGNSNGHSTANNSNGNGIPKSKLRGAFDGSQRGLGYSAIGALTGGLLGSELGKGTPVIPIAIGATVGALGANVYQGYDNKKYEREFEQSDRGQRQERRRAHDGYHSD